MFRVLRAFAWMRWRMLINSLEKTGARDTLERFSLAVENLGPIMAGIVMIPSALMLSVGGAAAGYALGRGDTFSMLFEAARYVLLVVPALAIVGPLLLPSADRSNPVRMLLLPISRTTLYVAQSASAFGDPWVLVMLPLVLFVAIGMLAAGAVTAAAVALAGAALLVAVVVGISSLATSLLHLAVRDRRRGELLALLFIIVIPVVSMLPGLLQGERRHRARTEGRAPAARERQVLPSWVSTAGQRAARLYPSELYISAARNAAQHQVGATAAPLAALGATAVLLHALGMLTFARVLESPGSTGARRAVPMRAAWGRTLPGLSSGASAVALAQLRLALRTPRGRSIMLSPIMMLVVFGVVMKRSSNGMDFAGFTMQSGLGLASFASFICLMSMLPIAMNQFAVDKAGVTLALLSPLTDREYLDGKAVGNALIVAGPILVCVLGPLIVFQGGSPALWAAIPLSLLATYFVVAPVAAIFSAVFPRVVDMNSIGRGSNAHGLAGLLGLVTCVAAAAPGLLITLGATRWLHQPSLVPVLLLVWCAIALAIDRLLFISARRIFAARRENLALTI